MRTNTPRILFVGKSLAGNSDLHSIFEGLGTGLHFAETLTEAASLLRRRRFDIVLSRTGLPEPRSSVPYLRKREE